MNTTMLGIQLIRVRQRSQLTFWAHRVIYLTMMLMSLLNISMVIGVVKSSSHIMV